MHGFPSNEMQVYASPRDLVETSKILKLSPHRHDLAVQFRCDRLEDSPRFPFPECHARIRTAVHHPGRHLAGRKMFIWRMRLRTWTIWRRITWKTWIWMIWRWSSTRSFEMHSAGDIRCHAPWFQPFPASAEELDLIEMIVTSSRYMRRNEATDIIVISAGVDGLRYSQRSRESWEFI